MIETVQRAGLFDTHAIQNFKFEISIDKLCPTLLNLDEDTTSNHSRLVSFGEGS